MSKYAEQIAEKRQQYIDMIKEAGKQPGRIMAMPVNHRYCTDIKAFFGYDQWALWCAVVEVMWLHMLEHRGFAKCAPDDGDVARLLSELTTTRQDQVEKETKHDILALIRIMREYFPTDVAKYLHFGLTSYDTIDSARALMFNQAFGQFIKPSLLELDMVWRAKIVEYAETIQMGRTHLQHALPTTVGFWLSVIHDRFYNNAMAAYESNRQLTGKISGAVGNSSALHALGIVTGQPHLERPLEITFQQTFLGLGCPMLSTQIVQPEIMSRHLHDLVLLSGSLAQLGNDIRILQSSDIGEIMSASSSSSTMAHKRGNPIVAENVSGMFTTIQAEYMKIFLNQVSDLQRDLTGSGPARDFIAVPAYLHQQIKNAIRLFKSIKIDAMRCQQNFHRSGYLTMAELLHLELMRNGITDSHHIVNTEIVPRAIRDGVALTDAVRDYLNEPGHDERIARAWEGIPETSKRLMFLPENYIGLAIEHAKNQSSKDLSLSMR